MFNFRHARNQGKIEKTYTIIMQTLTAKFLHWHLEKLP